MQAVATKSDLVVRDIDLLKKFSSVRVSFSINTLDEAFREEMDSAPNIERRFAAMKALHDEGIRTTCFISPIFPAVSDVKGIILRAKGICNLVWLENLNLRGSFKGAIISWVNEHHPELAGLYRAIYSHGDLSYWENLNEELKVFAESLGLEYLRNDDSMRRGFDEPPVVVNYFYHELVRKSGR